MNLIVQWTRNAPIQIVLIKCRISIKVCPIEHCTIVALKFSSRLSIVQADIACIGIKLRNSSLKFWQKQTNIFNGVSNVLSKKIWLVKNEKYCFYFGLIWFSLV